MCDRSNFVTKAFIKMDVSDEALLDIDLLADDASEDDGDGEALPSSGPASTPTSSTSSPPQGVEEPASPHSGWRGVLGATGSFFGNITSGLFGRMPYGLESKRGIGRKKREVKHPKEGKVVRRYRTGPAGRGAKRYRPSRDDSLEDLFDDDDLAMPAPEEAPFYPEKWPGKVCALCNLSERTQLGQGEMRHYECKTPATPTTPSDALGMLSPKPNEFSTPVSLEDSSALQQPLSLSRRTKGPNKNKTPLHNIEHTDELSIIGHSEPLEVSALVENNITYLHKACIDWSPPFEDVAVHAESSFSRPNHDDIGDNAIDNFPSQKSSLEEVRIRGILSLSLMRKCGFCNKYGASIPCKMSCSKYFHFPCVLASGGFLDFSTKSAFCKEHLYQTPLICTSDIVCRNCGVVGDLANLMTCVSCGCHYHGTCVGLAQLPGVRAGWACRSCRVCQVCHGSDAGHGPTEGRTVSCEQCDKLYHALCVRPAMTSVPKYGWKCKCCRMCTDCGARSPGAGLSSRWHAHYTVCDSCYQQRNKGSSCPLCKRAYRLAAQRDMVRCYGCKRYVHGSCDSDADLPTYNAKKLIQPEYEYLCPSCKTMGPAFFKRKDSLDDETISMSQESSVGDDTFLEQDPLVLDPRPDVGLGKGKPYTASSKICKIRMAGYKKGGIVAGKLSMLKRQRSGLIDFSRKRGPKTKMRGMFGVPGLGLQRPQLPDIKGGPDEEPGVENKLVLCSSKDKFVLTQDICVMCGAIGTDSEGCLIACTQCGQMYHPYCVNVKISAAVVQLGWRCIDCVACEGCGRRGDEGLLLMCEDCDVSWHTYCAVPPLTSVPQGAWRCPRCRRCRSCGITESGCAAWGRGYAECGQCASAVTCCLCSEAYCEGDLVIQCSACSRWLHGTCDTIVDEMDAEECCSSGYECPLCRPRDRAAPHVLRKRIEAERAAAAPPPPPPPIAPPMPLPVTLPILMSVPEPDTDHYYDGICLSSTGMRIMKELEATLALESKRKQRRSKHSEPNQDKDNVVLGSEADLGGFNVKPEGFDAPTEGVFVFKEGMVWNVSTDGPPPEGFNTFTSESGICMLRRKRQRNLHKLGIGGFSVKTRNPAKLYDDEKDNIVPDVANLSESPGTKRKVRRKLKSRLAESFPSYMQEAFFGRELLDPPRSDSTTPTLGMTTAAPLMPPAPSSISADSCESDDDGLISIDFLDGTDSAANIELNPEEADLVLSVKPKEEKVEVEKLSDSLSIDKTLNNMKMEVDTIKSEDMENDVKLGQPTLPHTGDVNQFDKNITSNSSDSDTIDNKSILQTNMPNDMPQSNQELSPKDDMSLIGVNLDVMVRETLPNMDSQDVEDIFKGVLTDDSQESQESSISYVNSISSSGGYNQQRQQLTSPMDYASPYHTEYSGNSQLSPAFSEGSGVWSTNMAGVSGPVVLSSGADLQPIVQGQLPSHPAPPPATYNQRSTDKMRADESLGAAATISAVLYANLTHPEWRTEFPTWSERCKQILKRWRALPQEEKAPYLQRARDNRSAIRMKKAQQMSAASEQQQPAASETTAVAETTPGPVSPQLQSGRAVPSPAQLPEVPAEDKDGLASSPIPLRQIPAPRARHSPAPNVTVNPFGALEPAPRRSPPTDHHIRVLTPSEIMRTLPCLPRALRDAAAPAAGTSPTHDVAVPDAERGAAVRSAREAEQERQWKNLQQMRQQQAQQQQQIIHDQRMQAVADNKDPQRCLFTYSNSMARVQRQTSTSPNSPYPEQSDVAAVSPISNNPPGMVIGPSVPAINSGVMAQGPSPELNRQLRDLLQRHHQPPKIWSMHGVSSEDEQQGQQNPVQSQHLQSPMGGRVGLPGEEPQFRQPLPPVVRPARPAPPTNLQHPQFVLRHHQPGLLAVQQGSQMQPRMPGAIQNVQHQQLLRGETSHSPNSAPSEKSTTGKTNQGPQASQNNEEMAEMDIDKLEQDNANMAEVGDILGGLGGEDDEELLVSLTAEMGDDFNILEYADPELDAFTDADTSHILDGLELADETPGALHCKREIDDETPTRKPEIKIEQGVSKAEKRLEPEMHTIKTESEIKTETLSDCQPDTMSHERQHEQLEIGNSVQQMNMDNLVSSQQSVVRFQQALRPNVVHQQIQHQFLKHQQTARQIEQLNRPTQLNINAQMTSADQTMALAAKQMPTQMTSAQHQIRPQFAQQIQQQVASAPSASTVQQQMAATVALALARGRPMAAGTRLVSPDGAVGVVRRDHTVALTYNPRPRPPPLPPPPPPYPGTPPQRLAPPQPPPPYPHQMSAEGKEGWSEWLRGPRPLLLQEQPLLLEELLEQEKRELEAGGVAPSGSVTPGSLISPVPGIIGTVSQGLTPPIGPPSIVGSPVVPDPPPVPAFLTTTLPAPPPPPAVIATDADRQAQLLYEQWLQQQNAIITHQLKHYETEVQKLRKIRKSLNSKQRQLRKSGNELSPNDAAELRRISAEQSTLQKHLEAARKQCRQHGLLMQEYRNKQQQPTQQIDSPISQSGPPQSPIFSRQNSIPQFQNQINANRPQQQVQQAGGLQMQSQLSQQMSQIQINNLNQQQHSQLSQQLHLSQHINQNNQQLRLNRQSPLLQQSMNQQVHQQSAQQAQSQIGHQQHSGEQLIIQGQQNHDANQQMHIQSQQMRLQAEINQQQILNQQQNNIEQQQQQQINQQAMQQMQLNHMQTQMNQQQVHMSPQQVHMSPQHQVHMSPQQQVHMSPHHQQQQQVQMSPQHQQVQMSPQHQQVQMSPQHALVQGGQGKPQVQMSPQHPHQQLQLNLQHSQLINQQQMMMNQQQQMISPQHQQQHVPLSPQMGHNQMQTSPQLSHHQVQMSPQMSHQQISFQRTSPMLGGASPSTGRSITPAPLHVHSPSHSPQLVGNQSPHAEFSPGGGGGSGGRSPFPRPAASRSPLSARFARPPPATQHHHQQGMRVGIPFSGRQTSPLGSPQPLMSPGGVCEPSRQQILQRQQYSPMGAPGSPLARSPHPVARTPTPSTPGASPADSPVPDLPHLASHLNSYEQGGGGGSSSLVPVSNEIRRPRYVRLGLFGGAPPPPWPPQTTSIQKITDSDMGQSTKPRRESHISKVSILKKKPQYKSRIGISTSIPASFPKGKSVNNAEFTEIDDCSSTPPLSPNPRKVETRDIDKIKTSQHIKSLLHNTGLTIKSLPGKKLPQVDEPSQNSDDDIVLIDSSPDEKSQILDYDDENDKNFVGAEVSLCAAAQGDSDHGELSVIEPFPSEMGDITESPLDSQEYVLFSSDGVVDYTVDSDDSMKQLSFMQKEDGLVIGYNRHVSDSNGEDVHMPSEGEDDVIIDRALNEKVLQSPTRLEEVQDNIDDDDDDIEETLDDSEIVVIDPNVISPEEHIATEEDFEELIDSRKPEEGSEGNEEDTFNKQLNESIETVKPTIVMPEQTAITTITRTETTKKTVAVISLATKSQQSSMHHLKIVKTGHNPTSIARLPVISATVLSPHSNTKILNEVSQATVASVSIANQTISVPVLKSLNVPIVPLSANNQIQNITTSSHMHKIPMSISTPSINIPISKSLTSVISVISSNVNMPRVATLSPVITLATSNATSSPRIPIPILSHHQIKQKIVKTIEKPATLSLSTSKLSSLIVSQDTTLPSKIFQDEITSPDILQCQVDNNELNKLGSKSKREDDANSSKQPAIQNKTSFICDNVVTGKSSLMAHSKIEYGTISKHDIDIEKEITRHTELPSNVPNTDIKSCSILSRSSMTKSPERISEKIPDKIMEGDEEEKSVKVGFRGETFKLQKKELDKECSSSCSSKMELLTMKTIKAIANQTKDMVLDSNMQITSDVSQESVQISIPSPTPSQEQYLDHITLQAHSDALAEVGVPTTKPVESFEEMLNILENITNEPKMFPLKMDEAKSDPKCGQDKGMNHSGNVSNVKEIIKINLEKNNLQKKEDTQKSKIPIHVIMRSQESAQSQISVSTSHHTTMVPQLSPLSQPTELTSTMANVSQQLRTIMSSLSTSKMDTSDKALPNKHPMQSDSSSTQVNYENLLPSTKVEIAVSRSSPVIKQAERIPECSTPPICIPMTNVNSIQSGNIVINPNNRNLQSNIVHLGKHSSATSIITNSSAITTATTAGLVVQNTKHIDLIASSAQLPQLTQVIQMPALSKIQSSSNQHVVSTVIQAGATLVNTTPVLQKTQLVSTNILSTTLLQSKRHIGSGPLQLPQQAVTSSQPPALIMTSRPGSIITSSQEQINIRHQNLMAVSKSFNTIVSNPTTLLHSQLTSPLKRSKSTDDPKSDAIGGHIQPAKRHSLESLIVKSEPMETDDTPSVASNITSSEALGGCKIYSIGTPTKSEDSQNVLLKQLLQNSGSCASVIPQRSNLVSHQRTAPSMGIVPSLEAQLARPSIPPPALPVSLINDDSSNQISRQIVSLETSFISKPASTTTISLTNVCSQTTTQSLMDVRKTPAKAQIKEESQITPTTSPSKLQFPSHSQIEVKKETVQPLQSPVIQTFNHQDIKKELLDETSQQSATSGISAASDQKIDIKEELSDIANTLKSIAESESSAAAAAQAKKRKRQEYQKKRKQMQNNSKIETTTTKKKPRKGSKIEEDYDTFIDNLMVQLRQLPPMQIQEPILSQNFGVCPVYGSGDLSKLKSKDYDVRCGDLIGEFGKARIPNVADHYNTKPFGDEDPMPEKPPSSTQRGFYDQEFSPIRFDDDSDDKKLELLCKERDTDTPDTIISSSSPECIGADDLYRFPGLKLIDIDNDADNYDTDTENNTCFSPVLPLIAPVPVRIKPLSPYNKDIDKDKAQSNFIGDNVSIKSKIDSPGSCDSGDNVTVTLTLTSGAAEDILGVLRELAGILHIPPPTAYHIIERTATPPSHKLGLYRSKGRDGKEGTPIDIQSILNGAAKFCRHCDVVILDNVIRAKASEFPLLSSLKPTGDEMIADTDADLFFCSTQCYDRFAWRPTNIIMDNKSSKDYNNDKEVQSLDDKKDEFDTASTESMETDELDIKPDIKDEKMALSFIDSLDNDDLLKDVGDVSNIPLDEEMKSIDSDSENHGLKLCTRDELERTLLKKQFRGLQYKYWSPGCITPPTKYKRPNERELTELVFRTGVAVMPTKPVEDLRRCALCGIQGDGVADGPSRLLNCDLDRWVHLNCALWSENVYETISGALMNVEMALAAGTNADCSFCHRIGATVRCFKTRCSNIYHLSCAVKDSCVFHKNKTTFCSNHLPKGEKDNELTTLSVQRRVYINRDEHRQVASVMQHSDMNYLIRVGSLIFLSVGHLLPHQLAAFHTPNYIYPVGYKIMRFYWSMRRANARCRYVCSIADSGGRPEFRISALEEGGSEGEEVEMRAPTARAAWARLLDALAVLREGMAPGALKLWPQYVTGEDLFGLTEPAVVRVLESLPGVDTLTDYRFKYGRSPLLEAPLAVNPSGAARSEPRGRAATHWRRPQRTAPVVHGAFSSFHSASSFHHGIVPSQMEPACPYTKQFVHSKSSQYKKMKQEWRNNVYLARSKIQGLGLYAARDLEKHTMVIEYIGEVIRHELSEMREKQYEAKNRGVYMFRLDERRVIDATLSGGLARYINHSCAPNCVAEAVEVDRNLRIIIFAKRRISRGEELAYDYKFDIEDDAHKIMCMCGAPNCRKWMN